VNDNHIRARLRSIAPPDELQAQRRVWNVVRAAFAEREPVSWPRRHTRPLLLAAAVAAVIAAAVTPPGRAVLGSIRDAVGRERVKPSKAALVSLPGGGRVLVAAPSGAWVVFSNGSRRMVGDYATAAWSPHGLYAVGTRAHELSAFEPYGKGRVHWAIARTGAVQDARWSPDGYRVAYRAGRELRIVAGDGTNDHALARAAPVAPAWRPTSGHVLAYVMPTGQVAVVDADSGRAFWRARGQAPVRSLAWSGDGRRLLIAGRTSLRVLAASGRPVGAFRAKGPIRAAEFAPGSHRLGFVLGGRGSTIFVADADRFRRSAKIVFSGAGTMSDLAWSPDAHWLLVGWASADQWLFIHSAPVKKIVAFSNVTREFGGTAFPRIEGWCCAS
jgi:hypothetical protein